MCFEVFLQYFCPTLGITPLNKCLQRIDKIKVIDQKRKKNKILMKNANHGSPEYNKREMKFINLNSCFLASVDALEKIMLSVVSSVFLSFDCFVHELVEKESFEVNKYLSEFTTQTEMVRMATLVQ